MTPERQSEIKEMIKSVRKSGQLPHEFLKAMDEMMATIEAIEDCDYVLNVDATWKAKNKEISDLRSALRDALFHIREHCSDYHYATPQSFKDKCEDLLLRE